MKPSNQFECIKEYPSIKTGVAISMTQSLKAAGIETVLDKGGYGKPWWYNGKQSNAKIFVKKGDVQKAKDIIKLSSFNELPLSKKQEKMGKIFNYFLLSMVGLMILLSILIYIK